MQLLQAWDRNLLVPNPLAYCSVDASMALDISALEDSINVCYKGIVSDVSNKNREDAWAKFVKTYNASGSAYITAMNASAKKLGLK